MVQYNLNKAIDTIEDSNGLEAGEKRDLIQRTCRHLQRGRFSADVEERMLQVTPPEEAFVFKNYEATINLYNTLTTEEKALSERWTTELAEGMCQFLTRSIKTLKDLNEYCYYVAGTVGMYLTALLKLKGSNVSEAVYRKLHANAVSFGRFLQKLNIIRDFAEDKAEKGRSYWPQSYFEQEKDRAKVLNRMAYETLNNDVPRAIEYFKHISHGNDSYDYFIRFILSSGIEYLKILRNNESVFSKEKVKLPKAFIKGLYAKVSSLTRKEFQAYCETLYSEEMANY
jgi:farnesyl-diphosphate farnesyltransferase